MKLARESFNSKIKNDFSSAVSTRHHFFLNRVVLDWNKLPENVNSFKVALDRFNCNGCNSTTSFNNGDGL